MRSFFIKNFWATASLFSNFDQPSSGHHFFEHSFRSLGAGEQALALQLPDGDLSAGTVLDLIQDLTVPRFTLLHPQVAQDIFLFTDKPLRQTDGSFSRWSIDVAF